jgi:hypothetical protein
MFLFSKIAIIFRFGLKFYFIYFQELLKFAQFTNRLNFVNFKVSKIVQVLVKRPPSNSTGTRSSG